MTYRALLVEKDDAGFRVGIRDQDESALPPGGVTLRVAWSSINYKDGLAQTPKGGVVRSYPMIPGIDLAGTVTASDDARWQPGAEVFVTGWGTGVSHPGGFSELQRVPADWVLPVPAGLDLRSVMVIGTAGFTAALSLDALERHGVTPQLGPLIVTGASGGVGSVGVELAARAGYQVAASTGKPGAHAFLRGLGASEILGRDEVSAESARPLEGERWAGAIDPVGGATTAYLLRTTRYFGAVAVSGLTGGTALPTTVLPFILRGVALLGIDSVMVPQERRGAVWARLGTDWKPERLLATGVTEIGLDEVEAASAAILRGELTGRTLVRLG